MKIHHFSIDEFGPYVELENGDKVYGMAGSAPFLFAALEQYIKEEDDPHEEKRARRMAVAAMQKNPGP
jgi:hypothetical protein